MPKNLKDALLKATLALPTGASSVTSTGIDTGVTPSGEQPSAVEWVITTPALAVGQLANGSTMKYDVIVSANSDLSSPTTFIATAVTQTGAGGAGSAAATPYRFKLPSTAPRYVGLKATNSAAADASAASATLEAVF